MGQSKVVICGVARTPIGRFMGTLSAFSGVDLGVAAVKELLARTGINPESGIIEEVLFGQVLQAGAGTKPSKTSCIGFWSSGFYSLYYHKQSMWFIVEGCYAGC